MEEVEKTDGKGTPPSAVPWESFPGPELSRSRRLEPSALGWVGLEPSRRLLKSLGLEPEGLDRVLKQSRPKGGRESRPIIERRELESASRGEGLRKDTSGTESRRKTSETTTRNNRDYKQFMNLLPGFN